MSYDPTLGRWLERDPEPYVDGMNPYEFVRSNPVGLVDPIGTQAATTQPRQRPPGFPGPWPEPYADPQPEPDAPPFKLFFMNPAVVEEGEQREFGIMAVVFNDAGTQPQMTTDVSVRTVPVTLSIANVTVMSGDFTVEWKKRSNGNPINTGSGAILRIKGVSVGEGKVTIAPSNGRAPATFRVIVVKRAACGDEGDTTEYFA